MQKSTMRSVQPDGIIITVGAKMYGEKGYRNWLRNFFDAMKRYDEDYFYWFRQGTVPKNESGLQYVYLCIGGKIRYRVYFAKAHASGQMTFDDGRSLYGKAWIGVAGPVVRTPHVIKMKGFQGFRYTEKLF